MGVYRLGPVLGRGGMATVYAASRVIADDIEFPVACKRIHAEALNDPTAWRQFAQEAFLCRAVCNAHPNLVDTYDLVEDGEGRFAIIMERVHGCTLHDLIGRALPLPEPLVRLIARELLSALAYLHQRSVVHRDVSPCNVLLSENGEVKLSDLGLAKLLRDGRGKSPYFIGKVTHASPEQLRADTIDARSDLYALGSVIYEMLTGAPPYGEERDRARVLARMQQGPPPLADSVSDDLRALVRGLLQHVREQRHPATADAALALINEEAERTATPEDLSERVIAVTQARAAGALTQQDTARIRHIGERDSLLTAGGASDAHRRRKTTARSPGPTRGVRAWRAAALGLAGTLVAVTWLWMPWHASPTAPAVVAETPPVSPAPDEDALFCEASEEEPFPIVAESPVGEHDAAAREQAPPAPPSPARRPRKAPHRLKPKAAVADEPLFSVVPKRDRSPWHIYLKKEETP